MFHYNYLLKFSDGMQYIGCRSSSIKPELDTCYLGSGKGLPDRDKSNCTKVILAEFPTRDEAIKAEVKYILDHDCVNSPEWYNRCYSANDRHGKTSDKCTGTKAMQSKLKGRTAETHEYIRKANEKRKAYSGANRTPAQIEADKVRKEKSKGKNPSKGHSSTTNPSFSPWYYIKDTGEKVIVSECTKKDYAPKLGITPRQLEHRFHHTNINKPAKQGKLKGWVFGNVSDLETEEG